MGQGHIGQSPMSREENIHFRLKVKAKLGKTSADNVAVKAHLNWKR